MDNPYLEKEPSTNTANCMEVQKRPVCFPEIDELIKPPTYEIFFRINCLNLKVQMPERVLKI